jgi:hypothetical protein
MFEIVPLFNPTAVNCVSYGIKWIQLDEPITIESTRASSHNGDLDKVYDPIRKNNNKPHRGAGPTISHSTMSIKSIA